MSSLCVHILRSIHVKLISFVDLFQRESSYPLSARPGQETSDTTRWTDKGPFTSSCWSTKRPLDQEAERHQHFFSVLKILSFIFLGLMSENEGENDWAIIIYGLIVWTIEHKCKGKENIWCKVFFSCFNSETFSWKNKTHFVWNLTFADAVVDWVRKGRLRRRGRGFEGAPVVAATARSPLKTTDARTRTSSPAAEAPCIFFSEVSPGFESPFFNEPADRVRFHRMLPF